MREKIYYFLDTSSKKIWKFLRYLPAFIFFSFFFTFRLRRVEEINICGFIAYFLFMISPFLYRNILRRLVFSKVQRRLITFSFWVAFLLFLTSSYLFELEHPFTYISPPCPAEGI